MARGLGGSELICGHVVVPREGMTMDKKQAETGRGFTTMSAERRRAMEASQRAAKLSQPAIEEKARKREHALSLAAAFRNWAGSDRP